MTLHAQNTANHRSLWAQENAILSDNVRVLSALNTGARPDRIVFRTPTPGPEYDVVSRFYEDGIDAKDGACLSIFIEPKVEGAFPDIVAVYWNPEVVESWKPERRVLGKDDLRHVHHLHLAGRLSMEDLVARLGKRKAAELTTRLLDAGVADKTHGGLKRRALKEIFAVTRIVALEAKISDWRKGLDQAVLNSWFSSETYLLLPGIPKSAQVLDEAGNLGVGVVIEGGNLSRPRLRANRERIPRSFASWLFNEWAWQTHVEAVC